MYRWAGVGQWESGLPRSLLRPVFIEIQGARWEPSGACGLGMRIGTSSTTEEFEMQQGETVNFQFSSADASTAAAVGIFNADGGVRTLGANERLIVDTLQGSLAAAVLTLNIFADANAGGTVGSGERVAVFGPGNNFFEANEEGYGLPVGIGLSAKASGAGQVDVTGSGRIVKGKSEGQRPSWRE